jgi:hypothetical protein
MLAMPAASYSRPGKYKSQRAFLLPAVFNTSSGRILSHLKPRVLADTLGLP